MARSPPSPRPALSLVTATFNRLSALRQAVQSVVQHGGDLPIEHIIVDDGSEDGSYEFIRTYQSEASIPVTCVRSDLNLGPGPARNLGLRHARGRYFLPFDSDFLLLPGALETVLRRIATQKNRQRVLFFPCLSYPGMRRLDSLRGEREISRDDLLYGGIRGELIPVVSLELLARRGLCYPSLKAGGESILWIRALEAGPGLFIDTPVLLYRTDVGDRVCTLEYQLRHAEEVAAVSEALLDLFPKGLRGRGRRARAKRLLAAGVFLLLAGRSTEGRRRLAESLAHGDLRAAPALAASCLGTRVFRRFFAAVRAKAYLN